MYDTVDPGAVPATGWDLLAGYVNGSLIRPSCPGLRARFPNAIIVSIDVENRPGSAQMLDIESGDATPADAPGWFDASQRLGVVRPTLYFAYGSWGDVSRAMGGRRYDYLVADYGASHSPLPGAVGWQRQNHGPHGENLDVSEIYDDSWNPTGPAPTPPEDDMATYLVSDKSGTNKGVYWMTDAGFVLPVFDPDSSSAFIAAGAKELPVSAAEFEHIAPLAR
jgi:hypothetical protein